MRIAKPRFFDAFHCIAAACPDSCCKEWDIQVDEAAAACYRSLPGPLGDKLREVLETVDDETVMTIQNGRCPMWRGDGLCRIQAELGEDALCETCRDFPRLTHDYGDFVERGLELSCPEAARMILNASREALSFVSTETAENGEADCDREAMAILLKTREKMLEILWDPNYGIGEVLALGLLYGYQAQAELDGAEPGPFDPDAALEEAHALAKVGDVSAMLGFFSELEILTKAWEERLHSPGPAAWEERYRALASYFVQRYWLQAISDYDLCGRVKFQVIACLLIKTLGGDLAATAQQFSKEIENDPENVEAILDGAYTHPAFTDEKLLGMLLMG